MPITILSKEYSDVFGNTLPFYQSNAGDKVLVKYKVLEQILVVSNPQNVLMLNFFENTCTWANGNWFKEGFNVGDVIQFRKYDSLGNLITIDGCTVISITGTNYSVLKVDDISSSVQINMSNNEILAVCPMTDYRAEEIVVTMNHVASGTAGSEYSLIDGEATVFRFNVRDVAGFPYIPAGTILQGEAVGKHSGQFEVECNILFTNETPTSVGYQIGLGSVYYINFTIINSGIYNEGWFNFNQCLKIHDRFEYARLLGQPFNRNVFFLTDEANTGWFDEAYNIGIVDSAVVQGISELAFDTPTSAQIIVDGTMPFGDVAIGGCYVSGDEDYYKNQIPSQSIFGMCIPSTPLFVFPQSSPINPDGAWWDLQVDSYSLTGTTWTIDITFIPMGNFDAFMNTRAEGDRTFYMWVKIGSVNLLVFNGQLVSNPPIGGLIKMTQSIFVDHSENWDDSIDSDSSYQANIEDDLGYIGHFRLEENQVYESMTARIEAHNTVSGDTFTLTSVNYNFNSVPLVAGRYVLNLTQPVLSIMPSTSVKRDSAFALEPSYDILGQYGVRIYLPFIYRWEYWLQQLNADSDFYPNQNKNWYPYGSVGDWNLRLHLELVKDGEAFVFDDAIRIKDYDSDPNIFQEIDLYRDSTGALVSVVIDSELHRIIATHTNLDLAPWGAKVWGMITIEPTESSPRWLVSTTVPFDNNSANPLTPISGLLMAITNPAPHIAVMECYFDSSKLNLANGVKITTKIKGCGEGALVGKLKTDNTLKMKTDGTIKQKSY